MINVMLINDAAIDAKAFCLLVVALIVLWQCGAAYFTGFFPI
jgi:hypothetical protein